MDLLKLICHCCKCTVPNELTVCCMTPGCNLFYCHRCLTSRYKYSYAKTAKLPTPKWKCPVCTRRCWCNECVQTGVAMPLKKSLNKNTTCVHQYRRKKRIRKGKRMADRSSLKIEFSVRTTPSEKVHQEVHSTISQYQLPSISGITSVTV